MSSERIKIGNQEFFGVFHANLSTISIQWRCHIPFNFTIELGCCCATDAVEGQPKCVSKRATMRQCVWLSSEAATNGVPAFRWHLGVFAGEVSWLRRCLFVALAMFLMLGRSSCKMVWLGDSWWVGVWFAEQCSLCGWACELGLRCSCFVNTKLLRFMRFRWHKVEQRERVFNTLSLFIGALVCWGRRHGSARFYGGGDLEGKLSDKTISARP